MKKEHKYIILIILSSLLSAIAVQGFVEPAHLYPAGFLGLSVFISNILSSFLHMNLSFNLIYLILNVLSVLKYLDSYAELFLLPHYINILSYIQDKILPISRKATILIFVCDCF